MSTVSLAHESIAEAVGRVLAERACHPRATYRLQFEHGKLAFRDAAALVPYLDELGISHVYASPYLKTRSDGNNNYAIVDYGRLDPDLGSEEDYRSLRDALHAHGMGQILDIVPNHMSAAPEENAWWADMLENGPGSPHAAYFDIDWHPLKEELQERVLLPMLGKQYGQALESGELQLEYRDGAFSVRYFQAVLPLDPRTYIVVLGHRLDELKAALPAESEDLRELESIITALQHLPDRAETNAELVVERQREKEVIKGRLRKLTAGSTAVAEFIDRNVREFNGRSDDPRSYDPLDRLLDQQVYRLSHWKAAADEINYRRFFDINDLAAVCMEDARVFEESHRLVCEMLARSEANGLRVDHIDGLYDPRDYLRRLQRCYVHAVAKEELRRRATGGDGAAENAEQADLDELAAAIVPPQPAPGRDWPLYVVAEKILGPEEPLPEPWLVAGTTGYDFLNSVNRLLVNPSGVTELIRVYDRFIDERLDFAEVAHQSKRLILREAMASELQLLARRLNRISERHRRCRDFTLNTLRVALREILAWFPVYRTYIREGEVSDRDRQVVCRAVAQAKRQNPASDAEAFDFLRGVLLLEQPPGLDEAGCRERELFVGRFQQVTSPVTAKGIEDTAFYRYFPLASLNEVGGDPRQHGVTIEDFHQQNIARQARSPETLLSTTTHDTKRSEDVRARIDVLSEIPLLWRSALNRWARLNRRHRREVDGQPAPSRNDEYLFYQTLVGVWPLSPPQREALAALIERLQHYMEKATREAKLHTSWISPDPDYDAAMREFIAGALDGRPKNAFLGALRRFHEQVVNWGLYNALSQTLLKLTSPGVPDIYQGQELWDFSLVDPDNRRPVDFPLRAEMLGQLRQAAGDESLRTLSRRLAENPRDSRIKLLVTWRTLELRSRRPDLFRLGEYVPLSVHGAKANHVCAFARRHWSTADDGPQTLVVIVPRWIAQLTPLPADGAPAPPPLGPAVWEDTRVEIGQPLGRLKNVFTGQVFQPAESQIPLAAVLSDFPIAALTD